MRHPGGIIALAALGSLLMCGASSPTSCQGGTSSGSIGPSNAELVGATVAVAAVLVVGTVVLVEVHKNRHNLKGCVTLGPEGFAVHNEEDLKVYALTGVTANVKVGDRIRVKGSKQKHQKDSVGDQDFIVEKMSRDYGPCKVALSQPAGKASTAGGL